MPIVGTTKMTARQYLQLGEDPPGVRLELVDGQIAVNPGKTLVHSASEVALTTLLLGHVEENDLGLLLGNIDVIFGKFDVRRPDFIFFCKDRRHLLKRNRVIDHPPDFAVEIVGIASRVIDREDKFKQYAEAGVAWYWIIDPQVRTVEVYALKAGRYVL